MDCLKVKKRILYNNRNLIRRFRDARLSAKYARRGAWYMVPLFDRENGYLYTVMREDRFADLRKKRDKRSKAHYLDALVQSFNIDLDAISQIELFDMPQFEEEEIKKIVDDILEDFEVKASFIRRHAVILFEEYNSEITAIRCCILDSSLQTVEEVDWSQYIANHESAIVEVTNKNEKSMPQITLKPKAKEKIGQRELVAVKREDKELEKENV